LIGRAFIARERSMTNIRYIIGIDLRLLMRSQGPAVLVPAVLFLVFIVVRTTHISSILFYLFLVQLSMGTVYNCMFARGKYESLLYSIVPFSERILLLAKNISCLIFTLLPLLLTISLLRILIRSPHEAIAVIVFEYVYSFILVSAAGNLISARRTKMAICAFSIIGLLVQFSIIGCGVLVYWLCRKMLGSPAMYIVSLLIVCLGYAASFNLAASWIRGGRTGYLDRI
jgi:hypothetical protein